MSAIQNVACSAVDRQLGTHHQPGNLSELSKPSALHQPSVTLDLMTRLRSPSVAVFMSRGTLLGQEAGQRDHRVTGLVPSALVALVEAKRKITL